MSPNRFALLDTTTFVAVVRSGIDGPNETIPPRSPHPSPPRTEPSPRRSDRIVKATPTSKGRNGTRSVTPSREASFSARSSASPKVITVASPAPRRAPPSASPVVAYSPAPRSGLGYVLSGTQLLNMAVPSPKLSRARGQQAQPQQVVNTPPGGTHRRLMFGGQARAPLPAAVAPLGHQLSDVHNATSTLSAVGGEHGEFVVVSMSKS